MDNNGQDPKLLGVEGLVLELTKHNYALEEAKQAFDGGIESGPVEVF